MSPETFSILLLEWWGDNKRELAWKDSTNPYNIWISEIILQQTRVSQGTPYYLNFISRFPDIFTLASASEDEVLKVWEGLGYYSRARNLHITAKYIQSKFNGNFPDNYDDILKLKGVGPYTAAAIASFAFGFRYPVVDGNVIRLISRILGISAPVTTIDVKKEIEKFVTESILNAHPASFNQAIMDFGALYCIPNQPQCPVCPFNSYCIAFQTDQIRDIPFKSKKTFKKTRHFHYLDIRLPDDYTIICQRSEKDIWKKLYELPMLESVTEKINVENMLTVLQNILTMPIQYKVEIKNIMALNQELTHRKIQATFYKVTLHQKIEKINKGHYLVERKKVSNFAFPKIITEYLKTIDV